MLEPRSLFMSWTLDPIRQIISVWSIYGRLSRSFTARGVTYGDPTVGIRLISSRVTKLSQRYNKNTCLTLVNQSSTATQYQLRTERNQGVRLTPCANYKRMQRTSLTLRFNTLLQIVLLYLNISSCTLKMRDTEIEGLAYFLVHKRYEHRIFIITGI